MKSLLLICKQTHTPENCGRRHPEENLENLNQVKKNLAESNIKLHAVYASNLSHTITIVVETESISELEKVLQPIFLMGTFEFLPAEDVTSMFVG